MNIKKAEGCKPENCSPEVCNIDIGDTEISYLLYDADAPTLILLHATGFLPWLWHPVARNLLKHFRIIAPYFCDHRDEDPNEGGLRWITLADDLKRMCNRLEIENPYMVGHSMGATVITLANGIYNLAAEKMILIEPIFLPQDFYKLNITVDQHPLAAKSMNRTDSWESEEVARNYLKSKKLFKVWDEEMLSLYIQHGMIERDGGGLKLACSPYREVSMFMGGIHYDPWPVLPKVTCPVLVIEGESSENRSYIDLKTAASLFKDGKYQLVRDAGHLIPMEKPVEITSMIKDFFEL